MLMPSLRWPLAVALAAALLVPGPARAGVEIKGLSRTTERAVRAGLSLEDEPCTVADVRLERLFRRADREIREALEVYGYFVPTIGKSLERGDDCWKARFTVDRGPRVRLRNVKVQVADDGAGDPALSRLVERSPFKPGDGLNQRSYDDYKQSVIALAQQRGYFDGRFVAARIDVYPDDLAADLTLDYAAGQRYRFGPVEFDQGVVREPIARSFVEFAPGEPYDAERINDLYTGLLVSGFFEGVEIRTTPRPGPDRDVAVTVVLTPSQPRTWTTGAGFATDTGIRGRMSFLHQRLNDRGHQFEASVEASQVIGGLSLTYRLPAGNPREEWLNFEAGYQYEDTDDNESDQFRIGVRQVRRRWRDWLETRFVNYRREEFTTGGEQGTSNLVLPGISLSTQPRVVPSRPRQGQRFFVQVSGTDEILGSDTAFLQLEGRARAIFPLWSTARLLTRAEAGFTAKSDFDELPFSVRYFAGGDDSVRGYDYKTLGPTDDQGLVIGGSGKFAASVEIDQRVLSNWSIAAFVDVGNAFDDWGSVSLKTGVGGGVRWFSPLGPIRFDVAVPLDRDAPDSFRIHVTLGPDL
ncbi:MAG: outer membrane protein assembly factor [Chromatiales bacterium]|jgi:translocation and assembly module TamA|nr:outer membrane protein assembly factor [Chromatiales bacterium]